MEARRGWAVKFLKKFDSYLKSSDHPWPFGDEAGYQKLCQVSLIVKTSSNSWERHGLGTVKKIVLIKYMSKIKHGSMRPNPVSPGFLG
jgi:hypothetical protein